MKKKDKNLFTDSEGIKYKQPNRTCKECEKYPCFEGIENMSCDFAKYGCTKYKDNSWKTNNV